MGTPIQSFTRDEAEIVEKGNMGGTKRRVALIRASAIATIPDRDASSNTISTALTFVDDTTEVFSIWEITKNSGDVRHEGQGETDGRSVRNHCEFSISGNPDKILYEIGRLLNELLICAIEDRQGQWRLVGSLEEPAELEETTGQVGKAPTDPRNLTLRISDDSQIPAPILTLPPQTEVTV